MTISNSLFATPKSVAEASRKQQLLNWEKSDANLTTALRRPVHHSKVQFTEIDVFLSACLSGDVEEVQSLLDRGADINTCTVDGLTALHQAVIDNKPDMVQFLCDHEADLNATDNEGWTPLHAAACCSNVRLVHFLCQEGADIAVTNSDKELALDLAVDDDCRLALEQEHRSRNIDPEECRNREMVLMRRDADEWLRSGQYRDRPHPKSGAYALHVAAAKGYIDVMRVQLHAGADVHCTDREGWTPLHAAAHWGNKEAISLLLAHGASLDALTNNGESVLAVADKEVTDLLNTARTSQDSASIQPALKRAGSVSSVLRMSTEDKSKKTKLDEQEEHRELTEGNYSFVVSKPVSPSVECILPCPPHRADRASSSMSHSDSVADSWSSASKTSPQQLSPSRSDSESSGSARPEPSSPPKHTASPEVSSRSMSSESAGPVKQDSVKNKWTARSASVQCSLPWMSLYKTAQPPSHPAFSHFQAALKHTPQPPLPLAVAGSAPPSTAQNRLPTPPTEPNLPQESEAERRSKAKRQRDSRRSTQGVTREQLRAATGIVVRESVTSQSAENSDVAVPSKETSTVKRRSQTTRNARRGTGPICVDEVQNALHAMTVHKEDSPTAVVQPSCSQLNTAPPVDYQLLYNNEKRETDRLKRQLNDATQQSHVVATNGVNRVLTRRIEAAVGKTPSIDDNERRSYERRICELEYELKQLQHLRTDNQKLKEENGALIRVISKLSK